MAPFNNWPTLNFQSYILPTLPFRRRSSTATTSSTQSSASTTSSSTSCQNPEAYLPGHASILRCVRCRAHLCSTSQIISKGFTGRYGKAYLVAPPSARAPPHLRGAGAFAPLGSGPELPNTTTHKPMPRQLVTGPHVVSDVSCSGCGSVLGWKYVAAEEETQRYKVGKVILETKRVWKCDLWELDLEDAGAGKGLVAGRGSQVVVGEEVVEECPVEFDSQDEDECEDLFLGIWSEALARKRRRENAWRKEE